VGDRQSNFTKTGTTSKIAWWSVARRLDGDDFEPFGRMVEAAAEIATSTTE
jgi:hypothetical protein